MPLVTFYFQLHQPRRLHPETGRFLWEENNREVFAKVADKCYIPATRLFVELVKRHPNFKVTLSMSGVFLEQAEAWRPEVIRLLHELYETGKDRRQVEYLQETYYHSLTGLFAEEQKQEFKDQVSLHRQKMRELFGVRPTAFRNTELMYNNDVANVVADMGFKAILCEQRDDMFTPRDGKAISPNAVFRACGRRGRSRDLMVLARNRHLSDDVAFRFGKGGLAPGQYAEHLARIDGEMVLLGYDYEHIGEHLWADTGIFEFWRGLPEALARHESIVMATPTEVARRFETANCPIVDIHPLSTSSWADVQRDTHGWLGSKAQYVLFHEIEGLEREAREAGGSLLQQWRYLTTSDNLYYLHEGRGPDRTVHDYFSPYGSVGMATFVLTRNIDNLKNRVAGFNIHKRSQATPVVIIAPESGRLPDEGMGPQARLVSGKSGGLGDVIAALCKGLAQRCIPTHVITLNLRRRFRQEASLSDEQWIQQRHHLNPENVHLVSSSLFDDLPGAYAGDPRQTAAEFQRQIVNTYLKEIRSRYEGRAIIHSHDWMAGGVVSAYARLRKIPVVHTLHNTHTAHIPLEGYSGVNLQRLHDYLYYSQDGGRVCLDAHATAVKNATLITFVGETFLREVVEDYFLDRPIIPVSVRNEVKAKFALEAARVVPNGISPDVYPENQPAGDNPEEPGLARTFRPDDDNLLEAKKANLVKFQRQMGLQVNPEAILLFWPSRLDTAQKGVELLEDIALKFVIENADVQMAIVGDPVSHEEAHADILGRIACASNGKIGYRRFNEDLCLLGYAAASDVFGASLYEPFGQIDVVGNIYGATATNRDTGGYRDKIVPLSLKAWGSPQDRGNGVLFRNYDAGGLWWGLEQTVMNHRFFRKHPQIWQAQIRRIMYEARTNWSLENMIAGYVTAYETLNQGRPLV